MDPPTHPPHAVGLTLSPVLEGVKSCPKTPAPGDKLSHPQHPGSSPSSQFIPIAALPPPVQPHPAPGRGLQPRPPPRHLSGVGDTFTPHGRARRE